MMQRVTSLTKGGGCLNNHECLSSLRGKLIVSCQALESEPLYCDERSLMGYMAKAA